MTRMLGMDCFVVVDVSAVCEVVVVLAEVSACVASLVSNRARD